MPARTKSLSESAVDRLTASIEALPTKEREEFERSSREAAMRFRQERDATRELFLMNPQEEAKH